MYRSTWFIHGLYLILVASTHIPVWLPFLHDKSCYCNMPNDVLWMDILLVSASSKWTYEYMLLKIKMHVHSVDVTKSLMSMCLFNVQTERSYVHMFIQ